jgi:DNA-binding response OmpR family regulator
MNRPDARRFHRPDRRRVPRGGRREYDRPGRDPMVLVAESYNEVRRVYVRYLNLFGFLVREAQSASEALEGVRAAPRVIVAEPNILVGSAARLWEQAPAGSESASIPIILLVADFELAEEVVRVFRPAAILQKPFHLATLMTTLRRILRTQAGVIS